MKRILTWVALALLGWQIPQAVGAEEGGKAAGDKPLVRAAIFVQNRGGRDLRERVDVLNDLVTARLSAKGFSVIDRHAVIARFRESGEESGALRTLADQAQGENAVAGASALRIAQQLGADYLIMAAITSLNTEIRTFKGEGTMFGTDNQLTIHTLRTTLKVLEGTHGGTVYGDTVTASERTTVGRNLTVDTNDIVSRLLETTARQLADNVAARLAEIGSRKGNVVPAVEFAITSNVAGVTVELDGAAIGSTPGRFKASPGLHQLRLSKEWLIPWERTVNIFADQALNVILELSEEGLRRFATLERLQAELAREKQQRELEGKERETAIGITREQSEADAYGKKAKADAEKKRLEDKPEQIEGEPPPAADK